MTTAIKANSSRVWHLTDNPPTYHRNESPIKTRCNRNLTIPETDRYGYQFNQMHTWAINQDPKQAWSICPKCGTIEDFMAASQERWAEAKQRNEAQKQAEEIAKQKSTDKATVLSKVWQQTLEALKEVGWQIEPPQYRRYRATMQVNGFTFEMEFVRPDSAFGVNLATCEVSEIVK